MDKLPSTHAIACDIKDVDEAESIFDAITYSKGFAVMKQLYELIGDEIFKEAIGNYFKKYAFKNTTLSDLLTEFQEVINIKHKDNLKEMKHLDLEQFKNDWIENAGQNQIQCEWDTNEKSPNCKLTCTQSATQEKFPVQRFHKINIGFYNNDGELVETKKVIIQNKKETLLEFDNSPERNIACIIPNIGDLGFIKGKLDINSLNWVKFNVNLIKDKSTKYLIFTALYDAVYDMDNFTSIEFIELALNQYTSIANIQIIDPLVTHILSFDYLPLDKIGVYRSKIFNKLLELIKIGYEDNKSIDRKFYATLLDNYVETDSDLKVLVEWLNENYPELEGWYPNIIQKWGIVFRMNCKKHLFEEYEIDNHTVNLTNLDTTDMKKKYGKAIEVVNKSMEEREYLYYELFNNENNQSTEQLQFSCKGFNSKWLHRDMKEKYYEFYWQLLPFVLTNKEREHAKAVYTYLQPEIEIIGEKFVTDFENFYKNCASELDGFWSKKIKADQDRVLQSQKIRAYAQKSI